MSVSVDAMCATRWKTVFTMSISFVSGLWMEVVLDLTGTGIGRYPPRVDEFLGHSDIRLD